jgi:hypothetical protein
VVECILWNSHSRSRTCTPGLAHPDHTDAKTVIAGTSAAQTVHGAGWHTTVDTAIGLLAGRTKTAHHTRLGALLVVSVTTLRSVVAAVRCRVIMLKLYGKTQKGSYKYSNYSFTCQTL